MVNDYSHLTKDSTIKKIISTLSDICHFLKTHTGNVVERIHAVRSIHPEGELHRMPRRQARTPAEHERKRHCLYAMEAIIAQFQ